MHNQQYMKQYTIYALIALLFTCLSGLKQDYKPITFKHHFDASISEYSFEFEIEIVAHCSSVAGFSTPSVLVSEGSTQEPLM